MTPADTAKRTNSPPLQWRGRGWGLTAERIAQLQNRAREMRTNPTEPEKRLWRHLSNSQLGHLKFRRQQVIGHYIADFICPAAKLIVEVDGDTHSAADDARRDAELAELGYRTLRVSNADIMGNMDGVLQRILDVAQEASPHPNPSPEGEGLEAMEAQKLLAISVEGSVK